MEAIDHRNLVSQLREIFPEVEPRYQEEMRTWGETPPSNYNIVAFVLKPYLREELKRGQITDFIRRLAEFMERICTSGDVEAINVVWLKLFKLFLGTPKDLNLIWPVMGPATKAEIRRAALRWGLLEKLPD